MDNHERPELADPMHIVASLLFLMTKHSHHGCAGLPPLIIEHLNFIQQYDSEQVTPLLRQVCRGLINQWCTYAEWVEKQQTDAAGKQTTEGPAGHLH